MQFALVAHDRPNRVALRTEIRPQHLEFLKSLGDTLVFAGPFLDEDGNMVGTIAVVEAGTLDEARAIYARDPFAQRGLFDSVTIRAWKMSLNNTKK